MFDFLHYAAYLSAVVNIAYFGEKNYSKMNISKFPFQLLKVILIFTSCFNLLLREVLEDTCVRAH